MYEYEYVQTGVLVLTSSAIGSVQIEKLVVAWFLDFGQGGERGEASNCVCVSQSWFVLRDSATIGNISSDLILHPTHSH